MTYKENFMNWDTPGVALITGASSGIGSEFVHQFAKQSFDLILIARRKERLDALKKELQEKFSVTVEILITDLSKLIEKEKIVSKILSLDNKKQK